MSAFAWLMARPIAHRGLHWAGGPLENTSAAAIAAISSGFAIECDVQLTSDGEAVVFHDFTLDRLTTASGRVDNARASTLSAIAFRNSSDHILALSDLLDLIDGRAPLVCEIKSRFNGDMRLARRVGVIAGSRPYPVALKSFDPDVICYLRQEASALRIQHVPLGVVAMANFSDPEAELHRADRDALAAFLHWEHTRPDFLSYCVDDLPAAVPHLLRKILGVPVMSWTVRSPEQAAAAQSWADQIIFELAPGQLRPPQPAPLRGP